MDAHHEIAARHLAIQGIGAEASALAMTYFANRDALAVSLKGAQDWLTEADGAVEALIRRRIAEAFPGDLVLGEEGGGEIGDRLWIVDPIDGTANFARGDLQWGISIGYLHQGRPEIGLLAAPALGEVFLARRGHGASLNGKPIRVAPTDTMARAAVEHGWSTRLPLDDYLGSVKRFFEAGAHVKRAASGALGMAWVACGRTDAYVEYHINAWDVAAGVVIVTEAGGRVNDFFTGDWATTGNPILAVTPGVADVASAVTGLTLPA
jgi:myo-inositol-1(or 4)-monophosphatase